MKVPKAVIECVYTQMHFLKLSNSKNTLSLLLDIFNIIMGSVGQSEK